MPRVIKRQSTKQVQEKLVVFLREGKTGNVTLDRGTQGGMTRTVEGHAFNAAFHPNYGYVQFCRVCHKTESDHVISP